jgi:hypothetical protein
MSSIMASEVNDTYQTWVQFQHRQPNMARQTFDGVAATSCHASAAES